MKKKYARSLYFIVPLCVGLPFLRASMSLSPTWKPAQEDFTVLSYNARIFNVYADLNQNFASSKAMIQWVKNDSSDIKCLQEFYNNDSDPIFNTRGKIGQLGQYQHYISAGNKLNAGNGFGLAIFSRFPIVAKGKLQFHQKTENQVIYADIVIKNDTVRIYNAHLQSMSINRQTFAGVQQFKYHFDELSEKMKEGMQAQARQVDKILTHIQESPHPVVLSGDLNALPYSYPYFSLKKELQNSFEKAGNGFGFTFNHPVLFFLRIDNQFFSESLSATKHQTHREVYFSDHFPIRVSYAFE